MCVFVYIVSKFFHTAIREDSGVFFAFLLPVCYPFLSYVIESPLFISVLICLLCFQTYNLNILKYSTGRAQGKHRNTVFQE